MSLLARLPIEPLRLISFHLRAAYTTTVTGNQDKKAYSHTLLLPKSSVSLKNKSPVHTEQRLRRRLSDELYIRQRKRDVPSFVFLDGPPYANGNLHMGHALNKVLKDLINRYKVMRGYNVHFQPGWDCHGLPIEQKALAQLGKSHTTMNPMDIRHVARQSALDAIEVQKQEMRDLGVMADWDSQRDTYRTMDHDYQIRQLKLFKKMVDDGHIVHRLKPTYYSPAARTALAEAELRYMDDHESRSVYVGLQVKQMSAGLQAAYDKMTTAVPLQLAIWTTTPWTLPSNLAVAVGEQLDYGIAQTADGRLLVIQADRLDPMQAVLGPLTMLASIKGADLIGTLYTLPLSSDTATVIHSHHVGTDSGTGLVHMAPVHGHEDYETFRSAGILPDDVVCPVDGAGCFDASLSSLVRPVVSEQLVGLPVLKEGNEAVIRVLAQGGLLIKEQRIKHRYPYDWKTKTPVIIRATPQWFADVEAVKSAAVASLDKTRFVPPISRHRLEAFITSRSEWCISRQRSWGVPIPILHDAQGVAVTEHLSKTIDLLDTHGVDYWWTAPASELSGRNDLTKGADTLDVWFDSGSAWSSIDRQQSADDCLADACLEGSDQHRGWFQSSLLTRLITTTGSAPVSKNIITHGFIVDENGRKMSKSDGNGISPMQVIHGDKGSTAYGADALRLWVASVDYTKDVSIGPQSISQASEMLRKLRSVLRFALANTGEPTDIAAADLSLIDRYVLHELAELVVKVQDAYDQFAFSRVLSSINAYTGMLSAVYYDAVKDVLYCDRVESPRRVAVVATLTEVLDVLLRVLAPIVPHLAEELNEASVKPHMPCIFDAGWKANLATYPEAKSDVEAILLVRSHVQVLTEQCRVEKLVRSSAEVDLTISGRSDARLLHHIDVLPRLLSVCRVVIDRVAPVAKWTRQHEVTPGMLLTLSPTEGQPCPRCWLHHAETEDALCRRCAECV